MAINLEKLDNIKKLTCKEMFDYITANDPDKLDEFTNSVCSLEYPKVAKPVFNTDGTPKMKTYETTKKGEKTGVWKEKRVVEMVSDETAEKQLVFNMLKAQRLFASWYKPSLLEPKGKVKTENPFMAHIKANETK